MTQIQTTGQNNFLCIKSLFGDLPLVLPRLQWYLQQAADMDSFHNCLEVNFFH